MRGLQGFVNILPYRVALLFGASAGWIGFHIVRWRVGKAKRRIREVLGETLPDREINRIAFLSMRYMIFNLIDVLRTPWWSKRMFDRHSNFSIAGDRLHQLLSDGRGAICALPHMGSWELGGIAATTYDVPLFFIVGVQKNPLFNDFLNHLRGITGTETIPRDDPALLKLVIRNLKAGKVLAMTNDLRNKTKGLDVRFLGKQANIVPGMALFARQAMVPIIPMVCYRDGWTRHRCIVFDPIEPDKALDKQEDWVRMTQATMDIYEQEIRKRPEQYFWYNKRWVLDPFNEAPAAP